MGRAKDLAKKNALRLRRKRRIRGDVSGTADMPRVSIFKSNKHLYAQAIDDVTGTTLAAVDGRRLGFGKNIESAKKVAASFAETLKAKPTKIKTIPKTAPVFASLKFVEIISKFVDPVNP